MSKTSLQVSLLGTFLGLSLAAALNADTLILKDGSQHDGTFVSGTENAEQTAAAVQQNLGSGLASQLEYRVAEESHLKTQTGLLEASYLHNVERAEWDRATGRYFQFAEDVR